jgi:peptidoglycan-associated lipoprotein
MRTTLIYPFIFALAAMLITSGCKHKTGKITPLPQGATPTPIRTEGEATTLPPGQPINPNETPTTTAIPAANPEEMYGMIPDRAALAAYSIHFAYDSSVVRKSEHANLQAVAQQLAADPNTKLLIEGHCDERGTEEYNRALGERRALAAREALAKMGVDPMRVFTRSYGKDKPMDMGHEEGAWTKNRRDEFVLLHPKNGETAPPANTMSGPQS